MPRVTEQLIEHFQNIDTLANKALGNGKPNSPDDAGWEHLQTIRSADFIDICSNLTNRASMQPGGYPDALMQILESDPTGSAVKGFLFAIGSLAGVEHNHTHHAQAAAFDMARASSAPILAAMKYGFEAQEGHERVRANEKTWTQRTGGQILLNNPDQLDSGYTISELANNVDFLYEIAKVMQHQDDKSEVWADFVANLNLQRERYTLGISGHGYQGITNIIREAVSQGLPNKFWDAKYLKSPERLAKEAEDAAKTPVVVEEPKPKDGRIMEDFCTYPVPH